MQSCFHTYIWGKLVEEKWGASGLFLTYLGSLIGESWQDSNTFFQKYGTRVCASRIELMRRLGLDVANLTGTCIDRRQKCIPFAKLSCSPELPPSTCLPSQNLAKARH